MTPNRALIIDDDVELCKLLKRCMDSDNRMQVDYCHNGSEGLSLLAEQDYQLVVLDVMLPEMDGFEILTAIRRVNTVPVLMLTAKVEEGSKVYGLRLGADDYLSKPFSINEFLARVDALVRRYTALNYAIKPESLQLTYKGGLIIDMLSRTVTVHEKAITLTPKEFDLLYYLAANKGKVFTKKQLYIQVWHDQFAFDDGNIMAYTSKIRKKLEAANNEINYIETIWGVGYRFNPEV
nr:response regulator transcription factor [Paenibacillus sp. Root52]